MSVTLYHAVITCLRDEGLTLGHARHVNTLKLPIVRRCFYYGIDINGKDPVCSGVTYEVPFFETYENLPLKTYGLLRHALTVPEWTHLLKTDVNSHPTFIDLALVASHHLVGFRSTTMASRSNHVSKVYQKGLAEPFFGDLPTVWCGGPAYVVSRLLATKIVDRGAWYARSWPYEDVMVSQVATESGWTPQQGVAYWTDGEEHGD